MNIKTCPFCGGKAKVFTIGEEYEYGSNPDANDHMDEETEHWMVKCTVCSSEAWDREKSTPRNAIKNWNTRVNEEKIAFTEKLFFKLVDNFPTMKLKDIVRDSKEAANLMFGGE